MEPGKWIFLELLMVVAMGMYVLLYGLRRWQSRTWIAAQINIFAEINFALLFLLLAWVSVGITNAERGSFTWELLVLVPMLLTVQSTALAAWYFYKMSKERPVEATWSKGVLRIDDLMQRLG